MTAKILYFPARLRLVSPSGTPAQDLDRALAMADHAKQSDAYEAASEIIRRACPTIARAYDPFGRAYQEGLARALGRIAGDPPSDTEPPGAA